MVLHIQGNPAFNVNPMKAPQYAVWYKIKTDWLSDNLSFQFKHYFNITIFLSVILQN